MLSLWRESIVLRKGKTVFRATNEPTRVIENRGGFFSRAAQLYVIKKRHMDLYSWSQINDINEREAQWMIKFSNALLSNLLEKKGDGWYVVIDELFDERVFCSIHYEEDNRHIEIDPIIQVGDGRWVDRFGKYLYTIEIPSGGVISFDLSTDSYAIYGIPHFIPWIWIKQVVDWRLNKVIYERKINSGPVETDFFASRLVRNNSISDTASSPVGVEDFNNAMINKWLYRGRVAPWGTSPIPSLPIRR